MRRALCFAALIATSGCSLLFDGSDLHGGQSLDLLGADLRSVLDMAHSDAKSESDIKRPTGCSPATKISFTASYFGGGGNPGVVAPGDFNGDGKVDFAVLAENDSTVYVFLSNGDGTFTPGAGSPIPVCANNDSASTIAAGRFSSTHLDVAVGCGNDSATSGTAKQTLYILPGNGSGGFGSIVTGPVLTSSVISLVTADFDADGNDDLGVGSQNSSGKTAAQLALQTTRGKLVLLPAFSTTSTDALTSLAAGDLNRDGAADLVVTSDSSNIALYISKRTPAPISWPLTTIAGATNISAYSAAVADLNGDSLPDLAIVDDNLPGADIFLQGAGTSFPSSPTEYSTGNGAYAEAVADFNCDGHLDVAISSPGSDAVTILRGNEGGTFAEPPADTETVFGAAGIFAADINGDGLPDLIVGGQASPAINVTILLNTSQ